MFKDRYMFHVLSPVDTRLMWYRYKTFMIIILSKFISSFKNTSIIFNYKNKPFYFPNKITLKKNPKSDVSSQYFSDSQVI